MKKLSAEKLYWSIVVGVFAGVGVLLVGTVITAYLINSESIAVDKADYAIVLILLAASMVTACVSGICTKSKKIWGIAISGACLLGVLIGTHVIFFSGSFSGLWVTALVVMAGTVCGYLLGNKKGKKKKYRISKMRNG